MKKITVYFLLVAVLAMALCGCGNDGIDNETSLLPDASPMISPDVVPDITTDTMPNTDDGVVNDRDGIIEDEDNGVMSTPSISPKVSDKH